MKKIVIIICWFGKFPWYYPYFIHSCGFNLTVDFKLITDNKSILISLPSNVQLINYSFGGIKKYIKEKHKLEINIENAYKLCDFKPAYGFIFNNLIKNYDYWGYCDLDIILGNIRKIWDKSILLNYDFINVRHDYTTGCFALFKNNVFMNQLFMKSKDFVKVFQDSKHYCFDECNFKWFEIMEGKDIFTLNTEIESMTEVIKRAQNNKEIKPYFNFIIAEGTPGDISFNKGKILYKNKYEVMLYHLRMFKLIYSQKSKINVIPNKYFISSHEIIL